MFESLKRRLLWPFLDQEYTIYSVEKLPTSDLILDIVEKRGKYTVKRRDMGSGTVWYWIEGDKLGRADVFDETDIVEALATYRYHEMFKKLGSR